MKLNLPAWAMRWVLNFWPCIRATGGRVTRISADFRELDVRLKLTWRTRNVVGTIYGGSLYASTDPFYMLMLMRILGPDYVVWDKGCTIRFKKPAKKNLFAQFRVTDERLAEIHASVLAKSHTTVTWTVQYKDSQGVVYAEFDKVLYVATKASYQARLRSGAAET
jgi:acyl-coenzyme A thioesterase PaaI-like protein